MLCSVVRTKMVALWVGASGVGVLSLFQGAQNLFSNMSSLNLPMSSVPAISTARGDARLAVGASVMRLQAMLGVVAMILMGVLSPLLSKLSFGTTAYAWGFAMLAPTLLMSTVASGRTSVLQGYGQLRTLARASVVWNLVAIALSLPLVYIFRIDGLVPMIVIYALCNMLVLLHVGQRVGWRRLLPEGDEKQLWNRLLRQGVAFSVGVFAGMGAEYAVKVWLSDNVDLTLVGLYQAGSVIIGSYLGMAFTAISLEFFPRLSTSIDSRWRTTVVLNHEVGLMSRIMLPAVLTFMSADTLVVYLLYSSEFIDASSYLCWAAAGTAPRAAAWCMSYAIIAKGRSRVYIITESTSAVALLLFSWLGWHFRSLEGLGMAYMAQMVVFFVAVALACHRRLGLTLDRKVMATVGTTFLIAAACAWARMYVAWWIPLAVAVGYAIVSLRNTRKNQAPA